MRVYVDSSALLKRVFSEAESEALISALRVHVSEGSVLVSSALAWVEVSRALRAYPGSLGPVEVGFVADTALSGVFEKPIGGDLLVAYDQRLIEATTTHGISTSSPGR